MRKKEGKKSRERRKLIIISVSILVSFFFHIGDFKFIWKLNLKQLSHNEYPPFVVKPVKHWCLSCCFSLAGPLFHFIVSVWMIWEGIFWMGLLATHRPLSSFYWKEAQLKSVSLPFHDTGMQWNQNPQDESAKASCFQLFSSAKIFFFSLPEMMLPFKGFLICKLFPQFISLQ